MYTILIEGGVFYGLFRTKLSAMEFVETARRSIILNDKGKPIDFTHVFVVPRIATQRK